MGCCGSKKDAEEPVKHAEVKVELEQDDKALYDRLYAPKYGGELVVFVHNVSHFNL